MSFTAEEMTTMLQEQGHVKKEEQTTTSTETTQQNANEQQQTTNTEEQTTTEAAKPNEGNPKPTETVIDDGKFVEYLKTKHGVEFSSPTELSTLKDRLALAKEFETSRQQIEEQKRFYTKPFANESVEKFNQFVMNTGIDNHSIYKRLSLIDPEQANAIEAIALKRVLDTPDLADDYDLVKKQVERNFPLTTSGDADEDDEDYQMEQLDMKQQKIQAVKALMEIKSKSFSEDAPEPWTEEKSTQLKTAWEPVLGKMLDELSKTEFKLNGDETLPFELDEQKKQVYFRDALQDAVANRMDITPESAKKIAISVYNRIRSENLETILQSATTHLISEGVRERIAKYNNPSTEKPDNNGGNEKQKTTQEELYEKITGRKLGQQFI